MKQIAFLALLVSASPLHAQCFLWGTSYTQTFNAISAGLPPGWEVDTAATGSTKGFPAVFDSAPAGWTGPSTTTGKFKNFASSQGYPAYTGVTTALQHADTDRALGVRQVAAVDPGAAFVFKIDNTIAMHSFNLSVRLQSLDSTSTRTAKWRVDYASGNNPTQWMKAPFQSGDSTTGGNTFSDSLLTASFGTALNDLSGPVWIRIVTLAPTSGSNSRPSTAIDDFYLSWTGFAPGPLRPAVVSTQPLSGASMVLPNAPLSITFNRTIDTGLGNIYLKNETTGATQTLASDPTNLTLSGKTATINGLQLLPGSAYHITFDSTAFDTAQFHAAGLYDTTAWRFSTVPGTVTVQNLAEDFEVDCLPSGWTTYSVDGTARWTCSPLPGYTRTMRMAGGPAAGESNDDWLFTPRIDGPVSRLEFGAYKTFSGPEPTVSLSTDYIGYGSPAGATWTVLPVSFSHADTATWKTFVTHFPRQNQPFFIAFRYRGADTAGYDLAIDNVSVSSPQSVGHPEEVALDAFVEAGPSADGFVLRITSTRPRKVRFLLCDLSGRAIRDIFLDLATGTNQLRANGLTLSPGLYLVRLWDSSASVTRKVPVR